MSAYLPGWDYADAYECVVVDAPDCAMAAVRSLLRPSPAGQCLMKGRDLFARVLSLKPAVAGHDELFPLVHVSQGLVVLGFDDRHLDFRIFVDVSAAAVRCTTAVRRHNALGRAYFAIVGPFHRLLVPHLLQRAARRDWCFSQTCSATEAPAA